jgi:outer membrane protein, heavy metal efflux system
VQLNVAARVKQAYFQVQRDNATRATLERNRDLLRKFLRISEARYGVGQGAQADIFKAQTQISILETRLTRLQQDIESRQAEINSLLNRQVETPLPAPQESDPKPLIESLEELTVAARENSPLLTRDQKTIERTELALNLARKEYYPDFTVSGGYYSMGSMGNMYEARVDFKLPLYFWRKQRAGVAEQASSASQARRAYEATGRTLEFRIKDDYLMAQTSYKLMELYGKTVIPQASLALESSLTSYQTGAVDFLTVLTNFMTIIEYEINYQEEVASYQQALARLEEMTGTRLIH